MHHLNSSVVRLPPLPQTLGVPLCHPLSLGSPSSWCPRVPVPASVGSWLPTHTWGGKRRMDKVLFSVQLSREFGWDWDRGILTGSDTGSPWRHSPGRARVLLGDPHHTGPLRKESPLAGVSPVPLWPLGRWRASTAPAQVSVPVGTAGDGTDALPVGWGFAGGCGTEGGGRERLCFPPHCRYPSPPAAALPWRWATPAGRARGMGTLCPVPSSVRGRGLQQAERTTL